MLSEQVLHRTMADVLCDVTQLSKIQKWVTLQPNQNYNTYKSCNSNHKLDMRAIADEISQELLGKRDGRRLVNNNGGRFPERTRSGSGRNVSNNRLRNFISKPRRTHKGNNIKNNINNRPRLRSVRFGTADAISSPPQLTSHSFRSVKLKSATGAVGDTRFRPGGRPSIAPVSSKPKLTENLSIPSTSSNGFRSQAAVKTFIQQQTSRNKNRFLLRDTSTSNKSVFSSDRLKSSNNFFSSNDCLFGICR